MAPTAAELSEQATDKRTRFADGKQGVSEQKETREFGQPYLRSWWPHFMLKLQGMRTSKFWVCGWFALFSFLFWPTTSYGPWLPGCLLQRRVPEGNICVWCVQSTIFLCNYSPTLLSGSTKWKDWRIDNWAKKWPIRASKRQNVKWQVFSVMTGFPQEIASLGFSGYISYLNSQTVQIKHGTKNKDPVCLKIDAPKIQWVYHDFPFNSFHERAEHEDKPGLVKVRRCGSDSHCEIWAIHGKNHGGPVVSYIKDLSRCIFKSWSMSHVTRKTQIIMIIQE